MASIGLRVNAMRVNTMRVRVIRVNSEVSRAKIDTETGFEIHATVTLEIVVCGFESEVGFATNGGLDPLKSA